MDEGDMQSCIYGWGIFPRHSLLIEEVQPAGHKRRHVFGRGIFHPDGFPLTISAVGSIWRIFESPNGSIDVNNGLSLDEAVQGEQVLLAKRGLGDDKLFHPFERIRMALDFAMLTKRLPCDGQPFPQEKVRVAKREGISFKSGGRACPLGNQGVLQGCPPVFGNGVQALEKV